MAEVTAGAIKALREKTGAGMMECKKALIEAEGNEERAIEILRERGLASAKKKEGRVAAEGVVGSYIHMGGKVGVLVEVNCETDFVARTPEFQTLAKEIAMHIAASNPLYVTKDEVPGNVLDKEREIYKAQAAAGGKPPAVQEKIAEGKLRTKLADIVLTEQPMANNMKYPNTSVGAALKKAGLEPARFVRFKVGAVTY